MTTDLKTNRPSSLDRRVLCTASAIFEKEFPDNSTSKVAEIGTKLHKLLETNQTPDDLDSDELWNLETARKQINKLVTDLEDKTQQPVHVRKELPVDVFIGFDQLTKGTADLVLFSSDTIVVIDYKSGRNIVDKASFQLQAYALGIHQKYGNKNTKVIVGVCQPYCYKKIQIMTFDPAVTENLFKELVIDQQEQPYVFNTGNHCKYCNYRTACPARNHTDKILVQRTKEITAEKVPEFLENYTLLKNLLEDTKEKAKQMIRDGLVENYSIELTKGNRKVSDVNGLYDCFKNYFKPQEIMQFCNISLGKFVNEAKRRVKNVENVKTLSEAEKRVNKSLEEFVSYQSPKEKIIKKI